MDSYARRAYTLVEILVVLVIIGFLAAMVTPKLAGVLFWGEKPIDTTNQIELTKVLQEFISQKERLPRGLLNLVNENNISSTYEMLTIYEGGEEKKELSDEFSYRLLPTIHYLNDDEALALKRLGINKLRNYKRTLLGGVSEYGVQTDVTEGVGVLMIGCGVDVGGDFAFAVSKKGKITDDGAGSIGYNELSGVALDVSATHEYACMDGAKYVGRIIMGVDDESELVKNGYLESSGTSPKDARKKKVEYMNYAILLPRLQESIARMEGKTNIQIRKYDKEIQHSYGYETKEVGSQKERLSDIVIVSPHGVVYTDMDFRYGVKMQ